MLIKEEEHFKKFSELLVKYKVRPTILDPLWKLGAFSLGIVSASLGKKATMACTEAVEEVIIDHYQKQTQYLKGKDDNLAKITKKFCEEEKEHLDFASEHDTGNDLFHNTLKKGIKLLSKTINTYDAVIISTDHDCIDYKLIGEHANLIIDTRNAMKFHKSKAKIIKA